MADDAVRIDVLLDDLKAEANLKNLESGSKRAFRTFETESRRGTAAARGFTSSLGGLRRAFGFVASLAGGFALAATIRKSVSAFIEQEQAVQRVTGALAVQGITSRAVSRELQDYAAQLQKITTYGDEAYLAGLALAMNMGSTVDQAKELTAAAADLSAALGQDLQTSIRMLGQTLSGQALTLARYLPAVRELSKEELRAGGAISFVRNRFGGMAAGLAQSDSGRYQQAINAFGDQLERLGGTVLPIFGEAIGKVTEGINLIFGSGDKPKLGLGDLALGEVQKFFQKQTAPYQSVNERMAQLGGRGFSLPKFDKETADSIQSIGNNLDGLSRAIAEIDAYIESRGTPNLQPWQPGYRPMKSDYMGGMPTNPISSRPKLMRQFEEGKAYLNQLLEGVRGPAGKLRGTGIDDLKDLLNTIEKTAGSAESAKALFDAINAPSADEMYRQRISGINAGLAAYYTTAGTITHPEGRKAEADAEKKRMQAEFELLGSTQPELLRFHDEMKLGVRDSFEGGVLTAVRGGGVRNALQQMSQALADSVSQALAKALTDRFLGGLLGQGGGFDKAFLSIFGGGSEAPAGAGATP